MKGDSSQDIPLVAGDTIYIAPVEKLVEISGEVRRPGAYEILPDDNFDVLLEMAGDIKPTGFAKRIQINTVLPNEERILREVDVSKKTNPPIFHGDEVLVLPIRDEILNLKPFDIISCTIIIILIKISSLGPNAIQTESTTDTQGPKN